LEAACAKTTTSCKGAVRLGPDDAEIDIDYDGDNSDLNTTFGHSPMGYVIQALRLEAAQYVSVFPFVIVL
jgi:hypothetical protein